jgi:hypothetical protein
MGRANLILSKHPWDTSVPMPCKNNENVLGAQANHAAAEALQVSGVKAAVDGAERAKNFVV